MAKTSGAQPGNKNAVKGRPWREALDRHLKRGGRAQLDKAASLLFEAASLGDLDAIKELANRLDGRPTQAVELDLTTTTTEKLLAAEERLRTYGAAVAAEAIETQEPGDEEWLQ